MSLQAGVAEADAVILRMPLHSLADNDADAQVTFPHYVSFISTGPNKHRNLSPSLSNTLKPRW